MRHLEVYFARTPLGYVFIFNRNYTVVESLEVQTFEIVSNIEEVLRIDSRVGIQTAYVCRISTF